MGNYDKMAEQAGRIFLEHDQEQILRRYPLESDENWIYIRFLGDVYRIDRKTGAVLRPEAADVGAGAGAGAAGPEAADAGAGVSAGFGGPEAGGRGGVIGDAAAAAASGPKDELADPRQALSILDMVCNRVGEPHLTGVWQTMQETSGAANAPATSSLFDAKIASFAGHADQLARGCEALGGKPVPGGEVSYLIEVFDGFPTWLQFWDADEEFGAELKFLWDKATPLYLHFETLWYIMFEILDRLAAREAGES